MILCNYLVNRCSTYFKYTQSGPFYSSGVVADANWHSSHLAGFDRKLGTFGGKLANDKHDQMTKMNKCPICA